jgi:hypothetical protein
VITEDDICNQLLDHWAEQNKPHLDDDEKCCYVLAVRAADEIRRLRAVLDGIPQEALDGGWTAKGISAYARGLECETERLRAEVEALRGVHEAATRVFKFHAVNKRNFFMAFRDLESNLDRVAEIDAARKGE